jgi:hypothetical protein
LFGLARVTRPYLWLARVFEAFFPELAALRLFVLLTGHETLIGLEAYPIVGEQSPTAN